MGRAGLKTCVKAVGSIESANEENCLVFRHEVGEFSLCTGDAGGTFSVTRSAIAERVQEKQRKGIMVVRSWSGGFWSKEDKL